MKKEMQKKLSFVLFVMAVFFAGVVLSAFSSSVVLVVVAGVLLLAASVYFVLFREEKAPSQSEKTSEILLGDRLAECIRSNEKAEKGVYIAIKKQHETIEHGMTLLEDKLSTLIKAQDNAVKTLVLYNKENAKQIALNEREEIEALRRELGEVVQKMAETPAESGMTEVVTAIREMSHQLYEELHESGEAILSELEATSDNVSEMKVLLKKVEETGLSVAATAQPMVSEPVAILEPEPLPEPEPIPEPEEEQTPEEGLAASGVDLSDPNKTLSAEDIAALFASMGNN